MIDSHQINHLLLAFYTYDSVATILSTFVYTRFQFNIPFRKALHEPLWMEVTMLLNSQYSVSYVFFKNIQHSNYTTFVCIFQMFLRFFCGEGWIRTTIYGFSVRHIDQLCHRSVISFILYNYMSIIPN